MPEATEEEWERRHETRQKTISLNKKTAEYKWFDETRASRERENEPLTPNPMDRGLSKRQWKHEVADWRDKLMKLYGEERSPGTKSDSFTEQNVDVA